MDFRTEFSGVRPSNIANGTPGRRWRQPGPPGGRRALFFMLRFRLFNPLRTATSLSSAAAPTLEEVQPKVKELIKGRVLVGHHISHDLRVRLTPALKCPCTDYFSRPCAGWLTAPWSPPHTSRPSRLHTRVATFVTRASTRRSVQV